MSVEWRKIGNGRRGEVSLVDEGNVSEKEVGLY